MTKYNELKEFVNTQHEIMEGSLNYSKTIDDSLDYKIEYFRSSIANEHSEIKGALIFCLIQNLIDRSQYNELFDLALNKYIELQSKGINELIMENKNG